MTQWTQDGKTIEFKDVSLTELGQAMGAFNKAFKILTGKDGTTKDFIDWIIAAEIGETVNE